MKNKALLIACLILCSHYLCNAQKIYSEEVQKKYFPKKEKKFKLSKHPFILNDTLIVDSNAVYVSSDFLCGLKCDSTFTYMRFFNYGKIFISFPYSSYPSIDEFRDLSYGRYGRYIVKDGIVKIEMFMDRHDGMKLIYAKPVPKGILFYLSTGTGIGVILNRRKSTEGGLYHKSPRTR